MTDEIEQKVAEFIRLHEIFAGTRGILLAVSGGADSISLLHILKALQKLGHLRAKLVCAHVNHRLRGLASDADERFVVAEAARLALPAITRSVDVPAYARTHGLSVETAGRQLRLAIFSEIARDHDCTWIATGHQKNDNAETVIHRLQRGTGFRGLAGIRPVRQLDNDLWLARPLLCVTRNEIVGYLGKHDLTWREDHTNVDSTYTRNYIRHRLLPLLQQESHASLIEQLSDLAASAGKLHDRVRREAEQAWPAMVQVADDEVRIDAPRLASEPEPIAVELIRRALASLGCGERDLTETHYRGILQSALRHTSAKGGDARFCVSTLPGGIAARCESGRIVLRRVCCAHHLQDAAQGIGVHSTPYVLAIPGRTRHAGYEIDARILERNDVDLAKIAGDKSPFIEYLDWDRVEPPVVVRSRQAGDRFQPLGLSGVKKVGKFLTAARATRDVRERTVVFADREKIIWVCPVRLADSVKVTEDTRRILALTVRSM